MTHNERPAIFGREVVFSGTFYVLAPTAHSLKKVIRKTCLPSFRKDGSIIPPVCFFCQGKFFTLQKNIAGDLIDAHITEGKGIFQAVHRPDIDVYSLFVQLFTRSLVRHL